MRSPSRRAAHLVVLVALVGGCSPATTGADPPGPTTPGPTSSSAGAVTNEPELVGIVSVTMGGGEVTAVPAPVGTRPELVAYLDGLTERARGEVRRVALTVEDRTSLTATVVDIGCTPPTDVSTVQTGDGWQVRAVATKDGSPELECFAPVTSVALVTLPTG